MLESIKNNPVILASVVTGAISLAVAFGLKVTPAQLAEITAFVGLVAGILARSKATGPVTAANLQAEIDKLKAGAK